jgi:transcriptional regulator NrdR family protein
MDDRPDTKIIRQETDKQIRSAYKECINRLTPWQRILIGIALDYDNNLYNAYERTNLVDDALEKGLIKRRYTYQAVKNHMDAAVRQLRNCMKRKIESIS